jgi:zinc protease
VEGRESDPEEMFSDLTLRLRYGKSIRYSNMDGKTLGLLDKAAAEKTWRERFADPGDFVFVFAGSFEDGAIREYCERYLGTLPVSGIKEEPADRGIPFPKGVTTESLAMGQDQKSQVYMAFGGRTSVVGYDYEVFNALMSLLDIRLREVVREDMGGSYGVSVNGIISVYPSPHYEIEVTFGCEPGRERELAAAVVAQMEALKASPVEESYLVKLRENYKRSMETGLRNNTFWVNMITGYLLKGRPLDSIRNIEGVTSLYTPEGLQGAAKRFFTTEDRIEAFLVPAKP